MRRRSSGLLVGEVKVGIDADNLLGVLGHEVCHGVLFLHCHSHHIGEVLLALGIIMADPT